MASCSRPLTRESPLPSSVLQGLPVKFKTEFDFFVYYKIR